MIRWVTAGLMISLAFSSVAFAGEGDDEKRACIHAAELVQRARMASDLVAAKEQARICVKDVCPALVREDCRKWRVEIEAQLPSIVVAVQDERGTDILSGELYVDGTPRGDRLDGRPLELNPGEHLIAVVDAVGNRVEKRIVLRIGEHNRTVPITLPGPPKEPKPEVKYAPAKPPPVQVTWTPGPAPAPRSKGIGPWPWVFWSVGAVGLGVFAYEGLQGRAEYNRLKEQCGNACDPRLGDPIRTKFLVADISLGVGLLSTGIGTLVALTTKRSLPSVGVHVQPDALVTTYGGAF